MSAMILPGAAMTSFGQIGTETTAPHCSARTTSSRASDAQGSSQNSSGGCGVLVDGAFVSSTSSSSDSGRLDATDPVWSLPLSEPAATRPTTAATTTSAAPGGAVLGIYNGDMTLHYAIPSEHVQPTQGSIKYVDHHTRYGAQTRFRFQLCQNFLLRKCPKLSECSYIHATQLPAPTRVHLNPFAPRRLAADRHGRANEIAPSAQDDPSVTAAYERLPPGAIFEVHPPQGNQVSSEITRVPSDQIFVTVGATEAWGRLVGSAQGLQEEGVPAAPVPRHCTKFQYRRSCPAGPTCRAIHSVIPFAGTALEALRPQQQPQQSPQQQQRKPAPPAQHTLVAAAHMGHHDTLVAAAQQLPPQPFVPAGPTAVVNAAPQGQQWMLPMPFQPQPQMSYLPTSVPMQMQPPYHAQPQQFQPQQQMSYLPTQQFQDAAPVMVYPQSFGFDVNGPTGAPWAYAAPPPPPAVEGAIWAPAPSHW